MFRYFDVCFDLLVKMHVLLRRYPQEVQSFAGGEENRHMVSMLQAHASLFDEFLNAHGL
jgi:hypothetical protein